MNESSNSTSPMCVSLGGEWRNTRNFQDFKITCIKNLRLSFVRIALVLYIDNRLIECWQDFDDLLQCSLIHREKDHQSVTALLTFDSRMYRGLQLSINR
jgi:hypothetical protein